MNIYLSHSRNFDFKKDLYEPLKTAADLNEHSFIFPHDESDVPFPTKEILESGQIDLVLAEVSFAATGQGIELGWAEMLHIPIVCVYKLDAKISGSLYVISNKFMEYLDPEDMVSKIEIVLEKLEGQKN